MSLSAAVFAQSDSTSWHQMGSDYVPTAITTTVEYDAETGDYVQVRKVGNVVKGNIYIVNGKKARKSLRAGS